MRPLEQQVGGNHYMRFVIQPVEFCHRNGLGTCEANVVKYVCRHKLKHGFEDLRKAMHYITLLMEMEYPDELARYEEQCSQCGQCDGCGHCGCSCHADNACHGEPAIEN